MDLVDTHQHLWDLTQFPYSWCSGLPTLNRSFRVNDYRDAIAGLPITKTIFVEGDVDEPHGLDEARAIQELAEKQPLIAGIVAACRPERSDFKSQLEALSQLSRVRGVRRVLHTQPDDLSSSLQFVENVRLLPAFNFTFDLCVLARQLPQAIALVRACPSVTFILDHCGVPDVKSHAFEPWKTHLREIAQFPNIACKISGLIAYADPHTWTAEELRPWVDHAIACFGWDRVLWGSDWPVCTLTAPLAAWSKATFTLTAGATELQRSKLYHLNAERIYRV